MNALSGYATIKSVARVNGEPLTPVRNFRAYLDGHGAGPKVPTSQVALHESDTVLNNTKLRRLRERPVPFDIDPSGTALHLAHIRISQTAPGPRLHFHDDT
ncbi:hypothetical protein, partial [Sciscionella sediminilitoris]|uniref:hypothetical protein n=1 Tax=Sciscionella sediminilitoris TaxID=1445613 RepID=UPI001E5E012A